MTELIVILLAGVLLLSVCQAVIDLYADGDGIDIGVDLGDPSGAEGSVQQHLLLDTLDELLRFVLVYDVCSSFFSISRHNELF